MASDPSVITSQVIDPRIDPQPAPVFLKNIPPVQNQPYHIPASGYNNSTINFNGISILGKDRAFADSFEIEITAKVEIYVGAITPSGTATNIGIADLPLRNYFMPVSFPLNSVTEQIRVNINGNAFFSRPQVVLRAKERYWNEKKIQKSFGNHTPCSKAWLQNEIPNPVWGSMANFDANFFRDYRVRMFGQHDGLSTRPCGPNSSVNFNIIDNYPADVRIVDQNNPAHWREFTVTWREPIFCSPFSSRYDQTYGRPLYNITSIDICYMMNDLRNMFLICHNHITEFKVSIQSAHLNYQIYTVDTPLIDHSFTVIPYRYFVPFPSVITQESNGKDIYRDVNLQSGVYTLKEIPTGIWIFAAPEMLEYQRFEWDGLPLNDNGSERTFNTGPYTSSSSYYGRKSCMCNNKLFGYLKHLDIMLGNTTQLLSTFSQLELYRIAKANGCQDSWEDWSTPEPWDTRTEVTVTQSGNPANVWAVTSARNARPVPGCGSVLRLIPGTDLVIPNQELVPGTMTSGLQFKVNAICDYFNPCKRTHKWTLWVLFEYVGVATITPGNCVVTLNPVGSGAGIGAAPVLPATSTDAELSTTEGSGWLDRIRSGLSAAHKFVKDHKLISRTLGLIPGMPSEYVAAVDRLGYGAIKRPRIDEEGENIANDAALNGGAIMGLGDFC